MTGSIVRPRVRLRLPAVPAGIRARLVVLASACMAAHFLFAPPAAARVYLKPAGQDAAPLRMKSVEADVAIAGGVAATTTQITFANETDQRIEADFLMTFPPGAVVTYFAYWYGEEKVVAQILEKERAAAIYKHITTRQRDPALVEMVGKNTFRARIFPVMPNADLKVEIHTVQALPTDRQGAFYTFPLLDEDADAAPLERIVLHLEVARDPTLRAMTNNLGLPVTSTGAGFAMDLRGENYRPTKDVRVNLVPVAAPPGAKFRAALYAARSGEPDGFFALTIVPYRALARPRVRISGVNAYDVLPAQVSAVPAHGALHLFGRYRGSGPARIEVRDGAWSGTVPVAFTDANGPDNPASKLWAAEAISTLSETAANSGRVVALSVRHNIPSPYTSWLAVPTEEMQRYWREKLQGDAETIAEQLAKEIDAGRSTGRKARTLRATLNVYARRMGTTPGEFLQSVYQARIYALATPLAVEEVEGRSNGRKARDLRERLAALGRRAGIDTRPTVAMERRNQASMRASDIARRLAPYIIAKREDDPEARRLRVDLEAMSRRADQSPGDSLQGYLYRTGSTIARRLAQAEHEGRAEPDADAQVQYLAHLERSAGMQPGQFLRDARRPYDWQDANRLTGQIADEVLSGRGEGETARSLRIDLDALVARSSVPPETATWGISNRLQQDLWDYTQALEQGRAKPGDLAAIRERWARGVPYGGPKLAELTTQLQQHIEDRMWGIASELVDERNALVPKAPAMADMEQRLARLSEAAGRPVAPFLAPREEWYRSDPLLRLRGEIIAERRQDSPDPRRLAELERSFLRQYADSPWSLRYGQDRLERIATAIELDKLDHIENPTDAQTARRTEVARRFEEVRARMGDPLLRVEAPADALRVVALMPDGTVKPLAWNAAAKRWEARFDIPAWAAEGTYPVTVIVVQKDGTRQMLTIRYHVDVTPPKGTGRARIAAGNRPVLRLEVEAEADVARVAALLPWGEEVALGRSGAPLRYFALAPIPQTWRDRAIPVTYTLTDRAHNRARLTVEAMP